MVKLNHNMKGCEQPMDYNLVTQGYVIPMYPNKYQRTMFFKTMGCVRFAWNHILAMQNDMLEEKGSILSYNDASKKLTSLKKSNIFLKEVDSTALQTAIKRQNKAFDEFFDKSDNGQPQFKKKKDDKSYTTKCNKDKDGNISIRINGSYIKLPKVGWVKIKPHQSVEGKIKEATIVYDGTGKFFVKVICDSVVKEKLPSTERAVGIDAGLKDLLILSDGTKYENKKFYVKSLLQLEKEQARLSHMTKGSNNYNRQKKKVARLHKKIRNQRLDYLHKLTKKIVMDYDFIAIETLDVKSLKESERESLVDSSETVSDNIRNRNVSDASWSLFFTLLTYKAEWYGKIVYAIPQYYPSSQTCHKCGHVNPEVKDTSVREWVCPHCGAYHDRDINAAMNILIEAIRNYLAGVPDGREVRRKSKSKKVKESKKENIINLGDISF